MDITREKKTAKYQGPDAGLILTAVSGMLVYFLARLYIKNIDTRYDDEISLVALVVFVGGLYAGSFISRLWITAANDVPTWILLLLPLIITTCVFFCALFASGFIKNHALMHGLFLAVPFVLLSLSLGMFAKLLKTRINRQLLEARATAAHSETELQLLQSQLSPHFLFNTLNNLYGLSITQHEKLPALLLKLSELLRYSVYDTIISQRLKVGQYLQ